MKKENRKGFLLRLTPAEKQLLIEKQKASNYRSVSEYIRHMCFQTHNNQMGITQDVPDAPEPVLSGSGVRNRRITFRVTEEEYTALAKCAENTSISAYCRKTVLTALLGTYHFEIADGDLKDISRELSEFNLRLQGILGALSHQSQLYRNNIVQIEKLLRETNEAILACYRTILSDRKYIRKKGIQNLKRQIEKRSFDPVGTT